MLCSEINLTHFDMDNIDHVIVNHLVGCKMARPKKIRWPLLCMSQSVWIEEWFS